MTDVNNQLNLPSMKRVSFIWGVLMSFTFCNVAMATNLFDSKRGAVEPEKKEEQKAKVTKPKASKVSFKLTAISKLANKYNLTFENVRKKEKVHSKWKKGEDLKESIIPGYYVYDVIERRVLFKALDGKKFRCQESKNEKVSCDPKNKIIAYELVTSKPLRTATVKKNQAKKNNNTNKNKEKQVKSNKQPFQPKRIEPQEVPDDMRLIKTPFGDRLVPK